MIVLHLIHIGYSWSLVMLSLFCLMTKRRIAPTPSHRYYSLALRYRESSDAVGAVSPAPSSELASGGALYTLSLAHTSPKLRDLRSN